MEKSMEDAIAAESVSKNRPELQGEIRIVNL